MRIRTLLYFLPALVLALCVSCQKDPKEGGSGSAPVGKTTVNFGTGRYMNGIARPFSLKTGDEVALVHAVSGEQSVAKPVSTGDNTSVYLFNLKKPSKGDVLVGYYPAAAGVSVGSDAVTLPFPEVQNGLNVDPIYVGSTKNTGDTYAGNSITLTPMTSLVVAQVQKGPYLVTKAEFRGNGGEGIAGTLTLDPVTMKVTGGTETTITVTPTEQVDCSLQARTIPILVPPMTFPSGFTITFTLSDGTTAEFTTSESVEFTPTTVFYTNPASSGRQLLAVGGGRVYLINEKLASATGNYKDGLLWTWVARDHATEIGRSISEDDHMDDAKPVDNNKNILVTSSNGWAALVEIETGKVLWSAIGISNAHSAEVLPGGRIAVAVSDGVDQVKLYNRSTPNSALASYPLKSAHGVVWSEKTQRLYAIGGTSVQIYKLKNWESSPELELERTVSSSGFVTGLHDMTLVDENTLVMGGNQAALFNLTSQSFTSLPHFSSYAGIKSININSATGEAYYTYGWSGHSEGDFAWSTHTIRYTDDIYANDGGIDKKTIKVDDINMYKVRVFTW